MNDFKAGQLRYHHHEWSRITSDYEVLQTISGLPIPIADLPDKSNRSYPVNKKDSKILDEEIDKLVTKGVVVPCNHEHGEFISPIFLTPKADGGFRFILNLKKLNSSIEKKKFKMSSVLAMIRPNMHMAKLDIKDAYYSIPVKASDQKYLKFEHNGQLFKFIALPNGYTEGPRKFSKVMKPPLASLRKDGVTSADYIDDLMILDRDPEQCLSNVIKTAKCLDKLGFIIHPEKSVFIPSTKIEFLGHIIDTLSMTVSLTKTKEDAIKSLCETSLDATEISIRNVARLLGKLVSSFIAVPYGRLHYRALERFKTEQLRIHAGRFDRNITLPPEARHEIKWWCRNIIGSTAPINRGNPKFSITSDSSLVGWGASRDGQTTGGQFTMEEKEDHINILELKAALFALKSLCGDTSNSHILIKIDNTSAVASINKMGSTKSVGMDELSHRIGDWACERNNWVTATHIPGVLNIEADRESRECADRTEWKLNPELFRKVINELESLPEIDLFASRINKQVDNFYSYRPDPDCLLVDAFMGDWGDKNIYAFPPFNCIGRMLQKICHDRAKGIIIVPDWPNQPWYTQVFDIAMKWIVLGPRKDLLLLPQKPCRHPMWKSLRLIAVLVQGKY